MEDTELIVTPVIHTIPRLNCMRVLQLYSVFVKDTTRLRVFQKADSFPQRPRVCFSLWTLAFLRVAVVTGGIVECSSTWSPAVLRPMSSSATFLARVDVCRARVGRAGRAGREISLLVVVFALPCLS